MFIIETLSRLVRQLRNNERGVTTVEYAIYARSNRNCRGVVWFGYFGSRDKRVLRDDRRTELVIAEPNAAT